MRHRADILLLLALAVATVYGSTALYAAPSAAVADNPAPPLQDQTAASKTPGHIDWVPIPGPGKKFKLDADHTFTYEFSQRPQMGTVILIIRVFDKKGDQVLPYKISGRSDMPEMRGAHDSGDVEFRTNKANNYLLPVNIVMPGDWEVRVTFSLNDKAVFHGSIRFDV
jgi:hypothetical protein